MEIYNNSQDTDFLYNKVAEGIEYQIEQGIFKMGDKLLSVRALSQQMGLSISTVFQAYSILEMKGLIEARPRSGYYVKFNLKELPEYPDEQISQLNEEGVIVSPDKLVSIVYNKLSDESLINFSVAGPAMELLPAAKMSKAMIEAIRSSPNSCLAYEDIQGHWALRKQIVRLSMNWSGVFSEQDIVTTQGCMEAIIFCLKAITKPGDVIAIDRPTYFGIYYAVESLGLKVLEIPGDTVKGPDVGYLEEVISNTKISACIFVTNYNNPNGSCIPDEQKKRLVEVLTKHEIPLIEDDIYGELYFGKQRPKNCKSYDTKGLVLLCSSFSKMLAPGYRVGWIIPGRYKEEVLRQKLMNSVSSATPNQVAIAIFLEKGRFELHMRNLRKALHTQCLRYIQAIREYFPPGVKMTRPQGGYSLWLQLSKKVDSQELFAAALREQINITPGTVFSSDSRYNHYIRITFGNPYTPEIEKGLKRLGELVRERTL